MKKLIRYRQQLASLAEQGLDDADGLACDSDSVLIGVPAARLLLGQLATHPITITITGDESLRSRPMARVTAPLRKFGARFDGAEGGRLPLTVSGASDPMPIE
mgnify:CR=1 FL=1